MKKLNLSLLFCLLFILLGCSKNSNGGSIGKDDDATQPTPTDQIFYAGASSKSIIPPQHQILGSRNVVHDPLYAKSLLLDDGDTKLLFIVLDLIGIDDYLVSVTKRKIYERTGIPERNVNISVTHTHSGLDLRRTGKTASGPWEGWSLDTHQNFVVEQSVESAVTAVTNLRPAQIGWGNVDVPAHAYNRRFKMKRKTWETPWGELEDVRTNPPFLDPDIIEALGPVDPEVSFISIKSIEGSPIALFANYSSHYAADAPANDLSADFYGVFAKRLVSLLKAENLSTPFVAIMSHGTGGDQNTVDRTKPYQSGSAYDKHEQVGFDLARAVYGVYANVQHKSWVKLAVAQTKMRLNVRKPTQEEVDYGNFLIERRQTPGTTYLHHPLETNYAYHLNRMNSFWPDQVDISLSVFRIGDLAVAAIPFEVFVETGLSIKEKSPFSSTFTLGLANGSFGYLPTERQHNLKGYETWKGLSNRVEKTAATKIEAEVLSLLSQLHE